MRSLENNIKKIFRKSAKRIVEEGVDSVFYYEVEEADPTLAPSDTVWTVELGIGRIPHAVQEFLAHKKDLGIHTEMFSDGVVELFARHRPGANTPFPPEDLLEAGILIYFGTATLFISHLH